jgi:hypothetical protein
MSETDVKVRPWCAKAVFPGLKEFILGTIVMPADAASHEIETALYDHAHKFLPSGFKIIEPLCGAIFFVPEEELK